MINDENWQSEKHIKYIENIKALGVMQGNGDERKYWKEKLRKCENKIKAWRMRMRKSTLDTVNNTGKFEVSSKPENGEIKEIKKVVWNFLWDG